jgi:hypothetical protein
LTETISERNAGGVFKTQEGLCDSEYRIHALLKIFCVLGMTYRPFLGRRLIYQEIFKLSSSDSYFFSLNAAMMFLGPLCISYLSAVFSRFALVNPVLPSLSSAASLSARWGG